MSRRVDWAGCAVLLAVFLLAAFFFIAEVAKAVAWIRWAVQ